ncbi:type VII secretion-associated protein, Rv3446c family, C-terminal domain-containing protein [Pseudonocardia thermophila]|uniref:Type VII secretion-associated protein, Rv3446c family, C-terminal domain-containing protein n=1 Tax=Pseudonocardia thermophila TaxID=1848 RepID=A0A1M6X4Z0_PSETH|nr:type VII secretion-associated protein [Pseudonocardia thermophila]SHL00855.1 type VII secretion-associated protein, Rv3446c family, C-terminal domain-containing protein [Pseudonocardia thermophila]
MPDPHLRVAVQPGAAVVRIAVAGRAGPQVVAQLPPGAGDLAEVVRRWGGRQPAELLLVHPATADPATVAATVAAAAPLARSVRAVPAPVAAAAGTDAVAVLDAGRTGVEITVLGSGTVRVPGGGAALDARLGVPAEVRERLSLRARDAGVVPALAEVLAGPVAALRAALDRAGVAGSVLLVGGLARIPELAEAVDAAGIAGARVPLRPEVAAVLGALRLPPLPAPEEEPESPRWLPPAPPPARRRVRAGAAALAAAGLLGIGQVLPSPPATVPLAIAPPGIVQYGYAAALPDGWAHTGGRPERRRTLLAPRTAPQGSDLIAIEASPLGYDATAEPERAARELRAVYEAGGSRLSGYDPGATYAGRAVTHYRQDGPDGLVVDWYVLFERDTQLSVGCQRTRAGAAAVAAACATVVGTLHRT